MTNLEQYQADLANIGINEAQSFYFEGIRTLMVRKLSGNLVGYVKWSDTEDDMTLEKAEEIFKCHGGVTFFGRRFDGYYLGFDTDGSRDWSLDLDGLSYTTYRGFDYIKGELELLAKQVAKLKG